MRGGRLEGGPGRGRREIQNDDAFREAAARLVWLGPFEREGGKKQEERLSAPDKTAKLVGLALTLSEYLVS